MADLKINALSQEHAFGARVSGLDLKALEDDAVRQQLNEVFEDRGVIVFEDVESSREMHFAVSDVFGPPQDYAIKNSAVESKTNRGVISLGAKENKGTIVEIGGETRAGFLSWHFDACYVPKLNRAGVLRLVTSPPEGGMTGFADGVQMYQALSPEWREKAERISVIYYQYNMYQHQRFGVRKDWKLLRLQEEAHEMFEISKAVPRSVHPAVWQRDSGEKVLHVSPWQADGIAGQEGAAGDALLEQLIQEMYRVMQPYWHDWRPTDLVIWDNWRFLHGSSGYDPKYARDPQRTTISGDYGLGCLLDDWNARSNMPA